MEGKTGEIRKEHKVKYERNTRCGRARAKSLARSADKSPKNRQNHYTFRSKQCSGQQRRGHSGSRVASAALRAGAGGRMDRLDEVHRIAVDVPLSERTAVFGRIGSC